MQKEIEEEILTLKSYIDEREDAEFRRKLHKFITSHRNNKNLSFKGVRVIPIK